MKKTLALLVLVSHSAVAGKWNDKNDPRNISEDYEYKLTALPLKATLPKHKTPWANSFWPRKKGSINYRWNTESPIGFKLNRPAEYVVRSMSLNELARLSPAEKFDLVQGHYDYPLSKSVEKGSKKTAKDFEGICDGWTASALQFAEPAPVTMKNPDGIVIPFGSSDIKALMSYDVSINMEMGALEADFVGEYCGTPLGRKLGLPGCNDVNPGALHVILANQLGLKQESVAADLDAGRETWNYPLIAYEFQIVGQAPVEKEVAEAYVVHAKITYAEDDPEGEKAPKVFTWNPTVGTPDYQSAVMELDYILELDFSGRIIGGKWLGSSKDRHPDLLWMPKAKIQWTPEFQILNSLYKPAF